MKGIIEMQFIMYIIGGVLTFFGVPLLPIFIALCGLVVFSPIIFIGTWLIIGVLKVFKFSIEKLGCFSIFFFMFLFLVGISLHAEYSSYKESKFEDGCHYEGYLINGEKLYFDTDKDDFDRYEINSDDNTMAWLCSREEAEKQGYKRGN